MPLFHIQDSDRPAWIVAANYLAAIRKWEQAILKENEPEEGDEPFEAEPPQGVQFVCGDDELIIDQDFGRPL